MKLETVTRTNCVGSLCLSVSYRDMNLMEVWCRITFPDFFRFFVLDRNNKLHHQEGVRG